MYAVLVIAGSFVGGVVADRLAPAAAMAAGHAGTQTAQQFVLFNAGGSKRAVMRVTPSGTAYLAMYDGHGRDRAEFHVAKDGGASIGFYDQSGSQRVLLGEAPGGRNGLAIYSNGGRQIATLTVAEETRPA